MARSRFALALPAVLLGFLCAPASAEPLPDSVKSFFATNCYQCHGATKQSADLDLEKLNTLELFAKERETFELALERIEKGEMPPPKQPRPETQSMQGTVKWLDEQIKLLNPKSTELPRITARRLNRTEYNNTVRDLLGVNIFPADDFPADDSGYGFDNIGDVLSMSPMLMEKYLKAAERTARTAVFGVEKLKPFAITHQPWYIDFDTTREVKFDYDQSGMSTPYSSHVIHRAPVDGDYEFTGWVRGFRPGGSAPLRIGFWVDGKMVHEGKVVVPNDGELNGLSDHFTTHLTAGDHWLSVTILNIFEGLPKSYNGPNPSDSTARVSKAPAEFFAQNIRLVGPFNQVMGPSRESLEKIFVCGHSDGKHSADCAKTIVTHLAGQAFRRPPTDAEISGLLNIVAMVQNEGDSFDEAICAAIQKMLISPHFIFRIEQDHVGAASAELSAHELATRLSYFLWSSLPDAELRARADDGTLKQPPVLEKQVRRMLADPRSFSLVENFGGQWLQFRALESHTVERKKFQQFTDYTIMSMRRETELFLENIMREDRSVLDLLASDYTFLNQRLAEFYGIPDVKGHEFRKVQLPENSPRGGVVTQGSVLTVSSYATRTSPVIRGKWVLENILNAAPPPPPADVPSLADEAVGKSVSLRQQLEKHRENATCAACHSQMDPLGFGLENFDAIGAWRDKDGNYDIDSTGELPDGRKFTGPGELKQILLSQKNSFAECLADKMLTYALGRGIVRADRPAIQDVAKKLTENDYRFSSLVLGVINTPQFATRQARQENP
jgi:mono/diheme cytochrome c family protein